MMIRMLLTAVIAVGLIGFVGATQTPSVANQVVVVTTDAAAVAAVVNRHVDVTRDVAKDVVAEAADAAAAHVAAC